jgi:hypothetical protein
MSEPKKVVRLEVEYVRKETVEFPFPDFHKDMGEAGWGAHAVGVMLRRIWTAAYGNRQSMQERVNFQQWRVVELCDAEHQDYGYEHEEWVRVPPFQDVVQCTRCGKRSGK